MCRPLLEGTASLQQFSPHVGKMDNAIQNNPGSTRSPLRKVFSNPKKADPYTDRSNLEGPWEMESSRLFLDEKH